MTRLAYPAAQEGSLLELRAARRGRAGIARTASGAAAALLDEGDAGLAAILSSPIARNGALADQRAWEEVEALLAAVPTSQALPRHGLPPHSLTPSELAAYRMPPPCAFLRVGQAFEGRQRVAHHLGPVPKQEHWQVHAVIQHYDPSSGYVAGTMEASNVPDMPHPVTTFFEGEIIDNQHHTFLTADWDACADTDFRHWSKFPPFRQIHAEVAQHGGRCPSLAAHPYVYMRWKERFFVRGSECRLTIAGFYYLAIHRSSGRVMGYYYDPSSSPDQKLDLAAVMAGHDGFAFPHYEYA